jgi:hypothetical protein
VQFIGAMVYGTVQELGLNLKNSLNFSHVVLTFYKILITNVFCFYCFMIKS